MLRALCKWGNRGTKEQALGLSACSPAFPVCSSIYTLGEAGLFRVLMGSGYSLHFSSTAETNFILLRNLFMGTSLVVQWSRSMLPMQGVLLVSLMAAYGIQMVLTQRNWKTSNCMNLVRLLEFKRDREVLCASDHVVAKNLT